MQYGSIGSRMTGAGFGGCTVNIVHKTQTNEFMTQVKNAYQQATGLTPEIIVAQVADGTKEV
jgi:galactokinase